MPKQTGTVRVKPVQGERCCYEVESWSEPGLSHRVDLLAYEGFGWCSCKNHAVVCRPAVKRGAEWLSKGAACRHLIAARMHFLKTVIMTLAAAEKDPNE